MTTILTSMFPAGLNEAQVQLFSDLLPHRRFAFVASDFHNTVAFSGDTFQNTARKIKNFPQTPCNPKKNGVYYHSIQSLQCGENPLFPLAQESRWLV